MPDVSHYFGSDLSLGATGDLLIAEGLDESTQRILRRLLTNVRDYLWQPDYGAGLPARIGMPLDRSELAGLIKAQMYAEGGISHDPEPVIGLEPIAQGISARITYTIEETGRAETLSFTVTP